MDLQAALHSAGLALNCHSERSEESASCFTGSINLSISFTGKGGDLVLASGSVDQTGTYVFEVEPQAVGSSRSKYTNYWGVANGNDTMFSLFNPTNAAQDILATFYYANGSGKYTLPVHLAPQASTMIDMAKLIAEHQPDAEGNVIPPSVQEGSAQFSSAKGRHEEITLVITGGIYNVATATCGATCITCCGDSNFGISPNPIYCPIGGPLQCGSTAVDCNGYGVSPTSWSSSDTAIMTVTSAGVVTGVAAGSATITATYSNVVMLTGQVCGGNPVCPRGSPTPQAPANIACKPNVSTSPQTPHCDGSTVYQAQVSISGQDYHNVTNIIATTSTDNIPLIELIGSPSTNPLCGTTATCYLQNYKVYPNTGSSSGNIIWDVKIYCHNPNAAVPDYEVTAKEKITCQ